MTKTRHNNASSNPRSKAPTVEELSLLGFEQWQIAIIKQYPPSAQWVAHDEFIRRIMSDEDTNDGF